MYLEDILPPALHGNLHTEHAGAVPNPGHLAHVARLAPGGYDAAGELDGVDLGGEVSEVSTPEERRTGLGVGGSPASS